MTRYAVPSLVVAVVTLGLALGAMILGLNLLPTRAEAVERGVYAPWVIGWMIVGLAMLCGALLTGFLVSVAVKGLSAESSRRM